MKNKEILKLAAGLTLGLAFALPSAPIAQAASPTATEEKEKSEKEKFDELYKLAEENLAILKNVKKLPKYKNASSKIVRSYDSLLRTFEEQFIATKNEKDRFTKDEEYYNSAFNLRIKMQDAIEEYNKLDGQATDRTDLLTLTSEELNYKATEEYRLASDSLKAAYDQAIKEANDALSKGAYITNVEKEYAENKVLNAKAAIRKAYDSVNAAKKLTEEIKKANEIAKDKALYTEKSYQVFNAALIAANTTKENAKSTLEQYQSALNALESAIESLEKLPTTEDEKKKEQIKNLKEAIYENEKIVKAARFLLDETPKTVEGVKDKLLKQIEKSEALTSKAKITLKRLEGIKGWLIQKQKAKLVKNYC